MFSIVSSRLRVAIKKLEQLSPSEQEASLATQDNICVHKL